MIISILHLSDIHFTKNRNVIFQRREKLFESIKNELKGKDSLFILTSGDIAFSGQTEEYKNAKAFYKYLFTALRDYTELKSYLIFVPGNHDCSFDSSTDNVRNIILKSFEKEGTGKISDDLIDVCCKPQANFFTFVAQVNEKLNFNGDQIFSNPLLKIVNFKVGEKILKFSCYNTAWDSTQNEKIGNLKFPIDYLYQDIPASENDLSISIVHHPFNWQTPETSRDFRDALLKTSEIVISGHEHQEQETLFSDLEEKYKTIHIESGALQETNNDRDSIFNIINIDLNKNQFKVLNYSYDISYSRYFLHKESEWEKIEKNKKLKSREFQLKKEFQEQFLENPGASFTHRNVDEIKLSDIYVPPIFNNLEIGKIEKSNFINFIQAETALELPNDELNYFKLILGSEGCGKTALLKNYYLKYYFKKFYPIFLSFDKITDVDKEKIKLLIAKEFKIQYDELEGNFDEIDFNKIILLIDDFHLIKQNKLKFSLINNLQNLFKKIIITGNELMLFESYADKKNHSVDLFDSFDQYTVQEFNPSLRNKLINKWYRLGKEYMDYEDKNEFYKEIDLATQSINTIIGKNLIPAYPIFILSILQALETGQSDSTSNNLHAYYYEMLITRSLKKKLKNQDEIGFYMTFSKEYCFFLFQEKIRFKPLSRDSFQTFLNYHSKKYDLTNLNIDLILETLNESRILKTNLDQTISVSYKYLYYYFVAKFLSDDLENTDTRKIIDRMTERLYREEYSNIIQFLTHLSKSNFIINKLIEKSKKIFEELPPIELETDIDFINNLQKELPAQVLKDLDIEEARNVDLEEEDEYELNEKEFEKQPFDEDYDLDEDINSIDILSIVTKAIRTMSILGQLTKKYWGELIGEDKYMLAEETFMLGLRTLKFNFNLLEKGKNSISEHIVKMIQKKFIKDDLSKKQVETISANFIFMLSNASTFGICKRIVNSIGTDKLSNTFLEIQKKNPFNSVMLINAGIKLDHYSGFPIQEIEELKSKNLKNPLVFSTLQNFVLDYFYMYPIAFDTKQKVCAMLNIKIQDQRFISQSSPIKKV